MANYSGSYTIGPTDHKYQNLTFAPTVAIVDNPTNFWIYLPKDQRWIEPNRLRVVVSIKHDSYQEFESDIAPANYTVVPNPAGTATIIFSDDPALIDSAGSAPQLVGITTPVSFSYGQPTTTIDGKLSNLPANTWTQLGTKLLYNAPDNLSKIYGVQMAHLQLTNSGNISVGIINDVTGTLQDPHIVLLSSWLNTGQSSVVGLTFNPPLDLTSLHTIYPLAFAAIADQINGFVHATLYLG